MMGMNEEEIRKLNVTLYNICGLIMNSEVIPTVASWLTFFQHPRQTLAYQQERGREFGLKYGHINGPINGRKLGLKYGPINGRKMAVKRSNKYHTELRKSLGKESAEITCLEKFDDWCSKKITSDKEKELITRYVRPDKDVSCVYVVSLSLIDVTFLLTYLIQFYSGII